MIVAGSTGDGGSVLGYEELLAEDGAPAPPVDVPNDSPALIMYTSGTTDIPRVPSSRTPIWLRKTMTAIYTSGPDINNDVAFVGVPLFHIAGIGNTLPGLTLGIPR